MTRLRLATRSSPQALTQATVVADRLGALGADVQLVHVDTRGDRTQGEEVPLHSIGGEGVFVAEVRQAVLRGSADLAVHSAKDLPTAPVAGLTIAALTARRTASDALIGRSITELSSGACVATGSVRRRAQLARARPDLEFVELRGNIGTRLDRVPDGGAIVMAVAALEVLDLTDRIAQVLDVAEFVPAVGQGCVAVECRDDDRRALDALGALDDPTSRHDVTVERAYLGELGSGCSLPVGAHVDGDRLYTFLAGRAVTVSETIGLVGDTEIDVTRAVTAARDALEHVGGF